MMDTNKDKPAEAFKITGNWSVQARQLKAKFSTLTDADLLFEKGKENELLNRVEKRLSKNREDVITMIKQGQKAKG